MLCVCIYVCVFLPIMVWKELHVEAGPWAYMLLSTHRTIFPFICFFFTIYFFFICRFCRCIPPDFLIHSPHYDHALCAQINAYDSLYCITHMYVYIRYLFWISFDCWSAFARLLVYAFIVILFSIYSFYFPLRYPLVYIYIYICSVYF